MSTLFSRYVLLKIVGVNAWIRRTKMFAPESVYHTKLFKRRWLVLAVFCSLNFSNAAQWLTFASISSAVHRHYGVSLFAVNCLSMVYMAAYIVFIIPASWLLDKYGLKITTVLGATLNVLGAWLKLSGSSSDGFGWIMAGQLLCAVAQCFILGIPPHLAAAWFGERERSTATALGVFANQVGTAFGFALPPILVQGSLSELQVSNGIQSLFEINGIITVFVGAAVLIAFESSPPTPPSQSRAALPERSPMPFAGVLSLFIKNTSFVILSVTYGLYCGVNYTVSTLFSQMISEKFTNHVFWAGILGCTFTLSGIPGSVLAGLWLDKTHAYKKGAIFLVSVSFLGMVGLTISLSLGRSVYMLFPIVSILGFFGTSFLPLGFEYGVELTYPLPEGTAAGLLSASAQVAGICLIVTVGEVLNRLNILTGNVILCGALLVAAGILPLIKEDLRRQRLDNTYQSLCTAVSEEWSAANWDPVIQSQRLTQE